MMKKEKAIDNIDDFVKALHDGKKRIGVTTDFYNYLSANIPSLEVKRESYNIPISFYYGIEIYIEKD